MIFVVVEKALNLSFSTTPVSFKSVKYRSISPTIFDFVRIMSPQVNSAHMGDQQSSPNGVGFWVKFIWSKSGMCCTVWWSQRVINFGFYGIKHGHERGQHLSMVGPDTGTEVPVPKYRYLVSEYRESTIWWCAGIVKSHASALLVFGWKYVFSPFK